MLRRRLFLGIFLLLSLVMTFSAGEYFVRLRGVHDVDGTFHFNGRPIRPFAIPVKKARAAVDQYLGSSSSFLVYDADLGWTHRSSGRTADGLARTNAAGLRADREYSLAKPPGTFRIAMFGDSFVLGSDVGQLDAPGAQLERMLAERGLQAEVLNFGVGGYGFDQAYLRYDREGRHYDADVIVQGLQLENIGRNVTILRIVAVPGTVIPFSKPRYVLRDGAVTLINRPALPPADVPATLADFERWPLLHYEASYLERYRRHWYSRSLLISTVVELWNGRQGAQSAEASEIYDADGEGMNITVWLLEQWRDEVTRSGRSFVLVYLPRAESISAGVSGEGIRGRHTSTACTASRSLILHRRWCATRRNMGWPHSLQATTALRAIASFPRRLKKLCGRLPRSGVAQTSRPPRQKEPFQSDLQASGANAKGSGLLARVELRFPALEAF